jgi:transposase-like protein
MASRESVDEVFLPYKNDCLEYLREQRWPVEVTCPHSESADTMKNGTTRKSAQRR